MTYDSTTLYDEGTYEETVVSGLGPVTFALGQSAAGHGRDDGSGVHQGFDTTAAPAVSGLGSVATSQVAHGGVTSGSAR